MENVNQLALFLVCCFAGTASAQNWPVAVEQQFDSGNYILQDEIPVSVTTFIYTLVDSSGVERFLAAYSIGGESRHFTQSDGMTTSDIPLSGTLWLEGLRQYDGSVWFQMYLEQIEPIDYPISNFDTDEINIGLGQQAALAGTGSFIEDVDGEPKGNMTADGVSFCLAETCAVGAEFRMVGFRFELNAQDQLVFGLNFADGEEVIFRQFGSFDGTKDGPPFLISQTFENGCSILGDLNLDGNVDLLDVGPFVDVLTTGQYNCAADFFPDGSIDLVDVTFFVNLLSSL